LEKTLNQNQQVAGFCLSLAHGADRSRDLLLEKRTWELLCYVALITVVSSFKTIYLKFDGFSTLVISFWLICTTRLWDRGSVWGHTLFLSELIFFSIRARTHFASRWRPSFDSRCEPCIVPKKIVNVFCLPTKILWETQLFFRSFKTVVSSTNSGSHCLSRKCRTYTFNNFLTGKVRKSKWGGLVWESKNRYSKKLYSTLANCATIQRTPLQGILSRDFPIFEGMKQFYYRHSAKKCIKYSFDSIAHLKTEHRLCFPTSDRLETWLLPSGPTWSRQYHESTMVWRKLPS